MSINRKKKEETIHIISAYSWDAQNTHLKRHLKHEIVSFGTGNYMATLHTVLTS